MTRSSQPIRTNILDFDDDFERTLRRKRKQSEPNPPSSSSEAESEFEERKKKKKPWKWTIVQSKSFLPRD